MFAGPLSALLSSYLPICPSVLSFLSCLLVLVLDHPHSGGPRGVLHAEREREERASCISLLSPPPPPRLSSPPSFIVTLTLSIHLFANQTNISNPFVVGCGFFFFVDVIVRVPAK